MSSARHFVGEIAHEIPTMSPPTQSCPSEPSPTPSLPIPTPAQRRYARQLYARHSESLLSFLRTMGRTSTADAADVVQQTFSELLRTLARHPTLEIRLPRAFLFKMGIRQLYAARRRGLRRPTVDSDAALETQPSGAAHDDLEVCATLRAEQRLVLRAMRSLDGTVGTATDSGPISPLQLLIYFRFWIGLTLEEVAEIFEVTPGIISGRQREALRRLRKRVAQLATHTDSSDSTSTTLLSRWRDVLEQTADALPRPGVRA